MHQSEEKLKINASSYTQYTQGKPAWRSINDISKDCSDDRIQWRRFMINPSAPNADLGKNNNNKKLNLLSDSQARLQIVIAVGKNLWLDNRHQTVLS